MLEFKLLHYVNKNNVVLKFLKNNLFLWLIILLILINFNYLFMTDEFIIQGKNIGTLWQVKIIKRYLSKIDKKQIKIAIQNQIINDEAKLSIWNNNSFISKFNRCHNNCQMFIDNNLARMIWQAVQIGYKTNGAMDITIGALTNLWGFGPNYYPRQGIPSDIEINFAKKQCGLKYIDIINHHNNQWILRKNKSGLNIDLSTILEGYIADNILNIIKKYNINNYLISVGGAVITNGLNKNLKPWHIAIQKPTDLENAVQLIVNLHGKSISTAGSYRNYYEFNKKRFSHIIDPFTGKPINHKLVSVSVICNTALEADTWDTGLMVLGEDKAKKLAIKENLAVFLISNTNNCLKSWASPKFIKFIVN